MYSLVECFKSEPCVQCSHILKLEARSIGGLQDKYIYRKLQKQHLSPL